VFPINWETLAHPVCITFARVKNRSIDRESPDSAHRHVAVFHTINDHDDDQHRVSGRCESRIRAE